MNAIDAAARTLGIRLDGAVRERLDAYAALLLEANTRFNLTAIRDIEGIERKLVSGSLEVLNYIPPGSRSIVDVGSGGGVPGMVLAIALPDVSVTLIDSTAKKVAFLRETASVLGLDNVSAIHGRAEELAHDAAHREQYSVGTARAVARLATLVELVVPFVAVGGTVILPKGPGAREEVEEARQAIGFVGGANPRTAESSLDDSLLVLLDKRKATPERFPRRVGIPARRPIGAPSG